MNAPHAHAPSPETRAQLDAIERALGKLKFATADELRGLVSMTHSLMMHRLAVLRYEGKIWPSGRTEKRGKSNGVAIWSLGRDPKLDTTCGKGESAYRPVVKQWSKATVPPRDPLDCALFGEKRVVGVTP